MVCPGTLAVLNQRGVHDCRVKVPGKLEEFKQAVQSHIPPAEHAALGNENNV